MFSRKMEMAGRRCRGVGGRRTSKSHRSSGRRSAIPRRNHGSGRNRRRRVLRAQVRWVSLVAGRGLVRMRVLRRREMVPAALPRRRRSWVRGAAVPCHLLPAVKECGLAGGGVLFLALGSRRRLSLGSSCGLAMLRLLLLGLWRRWSVGRSLPGQRLDRSRRDLRVTGAVMADFEILCRCRWTHLCMMILAVLCFRCISAVQRAPYPLTVRGETLISPDRSLRCFCRPSVVAALFPPPWLVRPRVLRPPRLRVLRRDRLRLRLLLVRVWRRSPRLVFSSG